MRRRACGSRISCHISVLNRRQRFQRTGARPSRQNGRENPADSNAIDFRTTIGPVRIAGVNNSMKIAREEIFGPVATIIPIDGMEDANDSIYGLAASIWTRDISKAHLFARDIEASVVWVNCFNHGDMTSIWGGYKQTGNGRDKCLEALTQYTQTKSVWVNLG
ncbi:aldehyde dehydrogenase family protein [Shinella sp. M27]|uniref:aldehyde dehydrogenase family protein n=1 Tax=Shinella sp. M27 TaxID=3368614 RepID=UPI003B9F9130